jgi:hypothetical protein
MSFLNQLKSQATALQTEHSAQKSQSAADLQATELACQTSWRYLSELAKQLNVIGPGGPALSLDGKTHWPPMKLVQFQVDARKKQLRGQEVFDYVAMGWQLVPRDGKPVPGSVSGNFPPDLQRIEVRLAAGSVRHEKVNVRHPEKNTLQAIRFDYHTQARAGINITANHDEGTLSFRLMGVQGFTVVTTAYPAVQVQSPVLDELAKLVVGQASTFV